MHNVFRVLATALLLAPAYADPGPSEVPTQPENATESAEAGPSQITGFGEFALRGRHVAEIPLDDLGTRESAASWLSSRLRLGLTYRPTSSIEVSAEGAVQVDRFGGTDVAHGTAVGTDTFRIRRDADRPLVRLLPRQLFVRILTPIGLFKCGHQAAHWGTGLLVNDGAHERPFGDSWAASLVERCLIAGRIGETFTVFAGGDYVYRDENADHHLGDRAFGWSLGLRYTRPKSEAGGQELEVALLTAQRFQTDRLDPRHPAGEKTELSVTSIDLHGRWAVSLSPNHGLSLEGEAAFIFGRTTRPYLEETYADGASVRALGGLGRVSYRWRTFEATLETGYASGDNDPQDDVVRQFTFHSGYTVGLVLFDQVLPLVTARSADRVMDPGLLAVPPAGTRFTVAQGGVRNAVYLNPVLRWAPLDQLELFLGYLYAQSAGDAIDLYQSSVQGSFNATVGGQQPGSRDLGQELNLKVVATLPTWGPLQTRIGAQGGYFLPGEAFAGVIDDPVSSGRLTLDLDW